MLPTNLSPETTNSVGLINRPALHVRPFSDAKWGWTLGECLQYLKSLNSSIGLGYTHNKYMNVCLHVRVFKYIKVTCHSQKLWYCTSNQLHFTIRASQSWYYLCWCFCQCPVSFQCSKQRTGEKTGWRDGSHVGSYPPFSSLLNSYL